MSEESVIAVDAESTDEASVVLPASDHHLHARHRKPIPVTVFFSVIAVAVYAAYERLGTTANADSIEFTQNLAGGFLAIGMTQDQPGFMVLSALDQDEVEVNATQAISRIAGTHTVVELHTPRKTTRARLRGPEVILVSDDGAVDRQDVGWTVAEFNALRRAADCSYDAAARKHRCGAPFKDLREALSRWPGKRVPERVRAFLAPRKDRGSHD